MATVINFHVILLHLTKAISFIVSYIVTFYRLHLLIDISIFFLMFNSGLSVFINELLLLILASADRKSMKNVKFAASGYLHDNTWS